MAQIRGKISFIDGCTFELYFHLCPLILRRLVVEIMSDLNRHGAWQSFGQKGYITPEDLANQYFDTDAFQRFIDTQEAAFLRVSEARFTCKTFQEFDLDVRITKKREKISPSKWIEINRALWNRGCMVICSKRIVKGWPVKVILGTYFGYPEPNAGFKALFLELTGAGNSPYEPGALYREDFPQSSPA